MELLALKMPTMATRFFNLEMMTFLKIVLMTMFMMTPSQECLNNQMVCLKKINNPVIIMTIMKRRTVTMMNLNMKMTTINNNKISGKLK